MCQPEVGSTAQERQLRRYRKAMLVCQSFILFSGGICEGIVGPTSLQLADKLSIGQDQVTGAFALCGIGEILGSLAGGLFKDNFLFYIEWFLGVSTAVMGVATATMPYCTGYATLATAFISQGLGYAAANAASMAYVVNLWDVDSGFAYGVITAAYAAGGVTAPLIAAIFYGKNQTLVHTSMETMKKLHPFYLQNHPYITDVQKSANVSANISKGIPTTVRSGEAPNETMESIYATGHVEGGYLITFALCLLNALMFALLAMNFIKPSMDIIVPHQDDAKRGDKEHNMDIDKENISKYFTSFVYIAFSIFSAAHHLIIQGIGRYVFPFSVIDLRMSTSNATILNTLYFAVPALSRLGYGFLVRIASTVVITNTGIAFAVVIAIIWGAYGLQSIAIWWCTIILLSFFIGILYPAGFSYVNVFMPVTGKLTACMEVGMSVGQLGFVIPAYFEKHVGSHAVLITFELAVIVCFTVTMATLGLYYGSRCLKLNVNVTQLSNNEMSHLVKAQG